MLDGPRNTEFLGGAYAAKTPQFHTMQQDANGSFHPTSVLQQVMPSGMGLSQADQSRRLYGGGMLASLNGSSPSTWQARTWLNTTQRQL